MLGGYGRENNAVKTGSTITDSLDFSSSDIEKRDNNLEAAHFLEMLSIKVSCVP